MTHTRGYARNKEQDMLEGTGKCIGQFVGRIASASGRIRALSQISSAHRNTSICDIGQFRRYSRIVADQFLPTHHQQ